MGKRQKKMRGRKRKQPKGSPVSESPQSGAKRRLPTDEKPRGFFKTGDPPGEPPSSTRDTPTPPRTNSRRAEPASDLERWISSIRDGEFDRKVKVRGRTGALLER